MNTDYDLIVIGAGSGGLAAAERAAAFGARVAIAEAGNVGGACINYGCIPEKLLDYAASFKTFNWVAARYGWKINNSADELHQPQFDWSEFIAAKDRHVQQLNQVHMRHLQEAGVEFIPGYAAFLDAHTVWIGDRGHPEQGRSVRADKILIAVGAEPSRPEIPGIEQTITWRELYHLPAQPNQIAIFGGDPIGVKVAGSLNALGSRVTQIVAEDQILAAWDAEFVQIIQDHMVQHGVEILCQTQIEQIERVGDRYTLELSGEKAGCLQVDMVLIDAPRRPNLTGLNLGKVGIQQTASGAIRVDAFSRTTQTNIFAVGDCTDRIPLTPSAIAQARAFADTEFGGHPHSVGYDWVPISIASHPQAATVGLSEAQARAKFGEAVQCYRTQFRPLLYCLTQAKEQSWIKLVVNRQDAERVVGVHMVGDAAVEIIQTLAVALKLGATKSDLDGAIGIHPSSAEELFSL